MGSWQLSILGSGPHDNNKPYDIEVLAEEFARLLQREGHMLERVDVTIGGRKNLYTAETPGSRLPKVTA